MNVMVTGGAGYIGSVTVAKLISAGHAVTVVDNLFRGHSQAVTTGARLVVSDLRDAEGLLRTVAEIAPEVVMHFGAMAQVGESVIDPLTYYETNTAGTYNLLRAMRHSDVDRIIFSSTAAVYGIPTRVPMLETDPVVPINPYGRSKLMAELAMQDCAAAYGLQYVAFRFFNVAGATEDIGEHHDPETHVIPVALAVAAGELPFFSVFGDDYDTPDGTAIRDYLHVADLADAHIRALDIVQTSPGAINLATSTGSSVRQVLQAVESATGKRVAVRVQARRAGDPPILIADASKATNVLGWTPQHSTLEEMVSSAWRWKIRQPGGYANSTIN